MIIMLIYAIVIMLATFISDAQDNVVEELPSAEQRGLLHLRLEVDWEPEIPHHYHVIVVIIT